MRITSKYGIIYFLVLFVLLLNIWTFVNRKSNDSSSINHDMILGKATNKCSSKDCLHTIVSPHIYEKIVDDKNIIYSADFQSAWDEFKRINGGIINMTYPTTHTLYLNSSQNILKNSKFSYSSAGLFTKDTSDRIQKDLQRKFDNQASPELLPADLPIGSLYTYSYLFAHLTFKHEFEKMDAPLEFNGKKVQAFGINKYDSSNKKMRLAADQVSYCEVNIKKNTNDHDFFQFHESNSNYIMKIDMDHSESQLILAEIEPQEDLYKTVIYTLNEMKNQKFYKMYDKDSLIIPYFSFDLFWNYDYLCFNPVISLNEEINGQYFEFAYHYIKFRLNEKGVILKAESQESLSIPINLILDKPFLLMMIEEKSELPYFAMWVGNPELMVPWKDAE